MNFVVKSILLGVALAMDAFSVSVANGLNDSRMNRRRAVLIAGTFAGFQFIMPMIGWVIVHNAAEAFSWFDRAIPWIALVLLGVIGGKMIYEGIRSAADGEKTRRELGFALLMLQGVATSIDALSTGFAISDYEAFEAFAASLIIAAVTFAICLTGVVLGRTIGMKLAGKAPIVGGAILIFIGIEIFIKGII